MDFNWGTSDLIGNQAVGIRAYSRISLHDEMSQEGIGEDTEFIDDISTSGDFGDQGKDLGTGPLIVHVSLNFKPLIVLCDGYMAIFFNTSLEKKTIHGFSKGPQFFRDPSLYAFFGCCLDFPVHGSSFSVEPSMMAQAFLMILETYSNRMIKLV
jgi:hypothetical protein